MLDPAIEDINTYSNIKVAYIVERRGRSVHAITFIFEDKDPREKMQSELRGSRILDRDDDYTQLATEMVPDPENPLRFTQTHKTGTDTTPQSITVPKRSTKPPKTAAEAKERMRETEKILQEERSRAKKPTNYGKRTDHAPPQAQDELFGHRPLLPPLRIWAATATRCRPRCRRFGNMRRWSAGVWANGRP